MGTTRKGTRMTGRAGNRKGNVCASVKLKGGPSLT